MEASERDEWLRAAWRVMVATSLDVRRLVFVDECGNASRRWCDSRDCGNRERVRNYLARKRASES